jgi:hypothetical protein
VLFTILISVISSVSKIHFMALRKFVSLVSIEAIGEVKKSIASPNSFCKTGSTQEKGQMINNGFGISTLSLVGKITFV